MKGITLPVLFLFSAGLMSGQTLPKHYYHMPPNGGSNNTYFHPSLSQKFQFIYTKSEISQMISPVSGPVIIDTIWFRHGGGFPSPSTILTNFTVRLGHTTLTAPTAQLNTNFNVGGAQTVVTSVSYTYTPLAGAWNLPADNWTYIKLQVPFSYNFTDNLCVELSFSSSNGFIMANYADNGGTALTQYTGNYLDTIATSTTSRPFFGISEGCPAANPQLGPDLNLCDQSSYTLNPGTQAAGTTLLWSNGSTGNSLSVNSSGVYWISATNSCGTEYDSITVNFANTPTVNAGADQQICAGQSGQLNGSSTGNFVWSTSAGLSATNILNPTFSTSTSVYYVLTASNGNCVASDTVNITVTPTPTVSAGADINAMAGGSVVLNGSGNGSYNWSPSAGLSCSNCANPTLVAVQNGQYVLTITDANGCTKSDTVNLFVEGSCDIFVPNVFTPNGDGINEEIRFDNACMKSISLDIFNRWGQIIYRCGSSPCIWRPKSEPEGVYYYIVKAMFYGDTEKTKTGYIQLLK